jgi:hypothetical protein
MDPGRKRAIMKKLLDEWNVGSEVKGNNFYATGGYLTPRAITLRGVEISPRSRQTVNKK